MQIAVTGGSGFIGRAVCRKIEMAGMEYVVLDRETGVDIEDLHAVMHFTEKCDAVIHLAGVLGTAELFLDPNEAIDVNIKGAVNMLRACAYHEMSYTAIQMPFTGWCNVCQATKLASMNFAQCWHKYHGVPVSFVTAYNVFGEGQKRLGVTKLIPTFAHAAWRNQPLKVWGSGEQMVDLVHVDDVAAMLVAATGYGSGHNFAAGTGQGRTVNEVAQMIIDITGSRSTIEHLPMRVGEVEDGIPPIANGDGWDILGWQPQFCISDFESTIEWYSTTRA